MNNLEMTADKAEKMSEAEDLALGIITEALSGVVDADDEQVKLASKMLGVAGKNRQTLTHRDAIGFGMAQLSLNEKELKKYVNATNPEIKKALTGK